MEALTNAKEYGNPQEYFGQLNESTARIRARLLDTQPTVDTERALLTTESYRAHEQDQVVLRRNLSFATLPMGNGLPRDPHPIG